MQTLVAEDSAAADDVMYDVYLGRLQDRFNHNIKCGPLFTTDAANLFDAYLAFTPASERQARTCNACRHFIERFGGLVTIDDQGGIRSALWDPNDASSNYQPAIRAMRDQVERAQVNGVFRSSDAVWGQPETGPWRHLAITPPASIVVSALSELTAYQQMAEKREDRANVIRAMNEFSFTDVDKALTILKADALYRSEKVLGAAQWLADLYKLRADHRHHGTLGNLIWRAVATAPTGFCHPRSSMIGSLLEDIAAGMSTDDVKRRFDAKMHPLQYQRPQAAPSAGTIAQAEKLFEQMGLAPALRRRFARLDDITDAHWLAPAPDAPKAAGVFGHLMPKGEQAADLVKLPQRVMTWDKFCRTVLPQARAIEYFVPVGRVSLAALVTAADADAPPILQWDGAEKRNPVSWYVYYGGSPAAQWSLAAGAFHKVNAICGSPTGWGRPEAPGHFPKSVLFVIDGCRETRFESLALFPETLRSELHSVRAVIEAHSRSGRIEGREDQSANGMLHTAGSAWNARIRVTTAESIAEYLLDRFD